MTLEEFFYKESLVTKSWSMGNLWFVIQDWFLFLMSFLSRFLHFIVTGNQVLMHWNVCKLVFFCCWCCTLPVCLTVSCKSALYQNFLAYHHTGQLGIDELCKVKSNGCKWQFITCCYCIQSGQITRYLLLWFGTDSRHSVLSISPLILVLRRHFLLSTWDEIWNFWSNHSYTLVASSN